jgi:hypothetical protein
MKRVLITALVLLALWAARPAMSILSRGFERGDTAGSLLFSIVLAAGEQASRPQGSRPACQR